MYDNSKDVGRWFSENGEVRRYQYNLTPDSLVIDLGGFRGEFAATIHQRYNCRVEIYEPVLQYYQECCKRNQVAIAAQKIGVHQAAVGAVDSATTVEISLEGDALSKNMLPGQTSLDTPTRRKW